MSKNKDDKEEYVMEIFKKNYSGLPLGVITKENPPLPDFVLTTINERIGIELTEAVISEDEYEHLSFKHKITDLVLDKVKDLLPFKFDINIETYKTIRLSQSEVNIVLDELVTLLTTDCMLLENFEVYKVYDLGENISSFPPNIQLIILNDGFRNLPKGIKSVKLGRYDSAGESWNSKLGSMVVPNFTDHVLNSILKKKETKKYEQCDKCWLLIWESGGENNYYHEINIEKKISSKFDRIFLARLYIPKIVELK